MYDDDSFISPVDYDTVIYPVQRVGSRALLEFKDVQQAASLATRRDNGLWLLQQQVFEARMEALKEMIRGGMQPVKEAMVVIDIRVIQACVSDEAGDVGYIEDSMDYVRAYQYGKQFN